jgi:hypothetical protein
MTTLEPLVHPGILVLTNIAVKIPPEPQLIPAEYSAGAFCNRGRKWKTTLSGM